MYATVDNHLVSFFVASDKCTSYPCVIFEDQFDTFDFKKWQHEITASGEGVSAYLHPTTILHILYIFIITYVLIWITSRRVHHALFCKIKTDTNWFSISVVFWLVHNNDQPTWWSLFIAGYSFSSTCSRDVSAMFYRTGSLRCMLTIEVIPG